ncbi:MAG: elongation factor Ts [Acidobacteria bacterium]|nr:MAG: elongation factor Ts [Acidobacteriota bacterium]MCE7960011.1 elongation factor Ts [Acidobacteria bacterium ACB2]
MEITTALIKELREKTGAGILDCKGALTETGGNLEEAEKVLRKKGLAAAAKKAGRVAADGLIGFRCDGATAALVELNSETDFVAKTDEFGAARKVLADLVFETSSLGDAPEGNGEALRATPAPKALASSGTISEWLQAFTAKTGENTQLRRFSRLVAAPGGKLTLYAHPGDKTVVVVETAGCPDDLAKDVAMHVAALTPQYASREDVPEKTLADEREIARAKAQASGKPEAVVEKMAEGMIAKWYSEVVLVDQAFAKDDSKKVGQVLAERGGKEAKVRRFVRFRVGEGVEKRSDDFAAEVAALTK